MFFFEPALSGYVEARADEGQLIRCVSIGVDAAEQSLSGGCVPKAPIHIHAHGVSVDLHDLVIGDAGINDFGKIYGIRIALQENPPRDVPDHGGGRVFDGPNEPFGHGFFILMER